MKDNVNCMIHGKQFAEVPISRVAEELGRRLNQWRLSREIKVADMAEEMGVSRPTLQRLLEGNKTSSETFLRALLALDLIENLDILIPDIGASPMALLEGRASPGARKRVSARKTSRAEGVWTWADETGSE